jgi:hypothetical protein
MIGNSDSGNTKLKIWTSNLKYKHTPNDPVPASSNKLGGDLT